MTTSLAARNSRLVQRVMDGLPLILLRVKRTVGRVSNVVFGAAQTVYRAVAPRIKVMATF